MKELESLVTSNMGKVPVGYNLLSKGQMNKSKKVSKGVFIPYYQTDLKRVYGPYKPISRCILLLDINE